MSNSSNLSRLGKHGLQPFGHAGLLCLVVGPCPAAPDTKALRNRGGTVTIRVQPVEQGCRQNLVLQRQAVDELGLEDLAITIGVRTLDNALGLTR